MTQNERAKAFRRERARQIRRRGAIWRDTQTEIVRLLKLAAERIGATLAAQPSDYQQWILPQVQREIGQALRALSDQSAATISSAAGTAWTAGQDLIDAPLAAGGVRLSGIAPLIDTRQLLAMRAFMTDRIRDIGVAAANKINTALGLVVIGNQSPSEAITALTRILGEQARARATTIVRTELGRVYAVAAQERVSQAAQFVPGMKKQWRRSGKIHSRPHHDAADGQVQPVDKPFLVGGHKLMHPIDPKAPASETINCGCAMLPWKEDWEMSTPGRKPFSPEEIARDPRRHLAQVPRA